MLSQIVFLTLVVATTAQVVKLDFNPAVFNRSTRAAGDIAACTGGGPACDPTCRKTGICIWEGDNYVFHETADCGKDRFCHSEATTTAVTCATTPGTCIPNKADIGCDMTGSFPDLYNCRNIVSCTKGDVGEPMTICNSDLGFDACTGYCDYVLSTGKCTPVPALCKYAGQVEKLNVNNRIYYYCVQDSDGLLHPVIGRCSRGYFDEDRYQCVESEVPGCIAP